VMWPHELGPRGLCLVVAPLVMSAALLGAPAAAVAVGYRVVESRSADRIIFTFDGGTPSWTHAGYVARCRVHLKRNPSTSRQRHPGGDPSNATLRAT
jgi:hypothetical protein